MSIPDDGGIATGGHTVSVRTNNVAGYSLSYWADDGNDNNKEDNALINTLNSNYRIEPNEVDLDNYVAYPLNNNRWGFAIIPPNNVSFVIHPFSDEQLYIDNDSKAAYAPVFTKSIAEQDANLSVAPASPSSANGDNYHIYYGVRVDKPSELLAGNYTAQVVYTATAKEVKVPKLTAIDPPSYELGSVSSGQITITGNNLLSAYEVYLTNTNGDRAGECTNLNVVDNNSISCTIPTTGIAAGSYTTHVVTQGGEGSIGFAYTKKTLPDGILESTDDYRNDGRVAVDYDENMIPVTYTGNGSSPQWTALPKSEISSNPKSWYDYPNKIWANAVTVKDPTKYNDIATRTTVDNADILGYWVYIPRYAYEVQRRDTSDAPVQPQNFNIVFQTSDQMNTPVKTCSTANNNKDYRTGCNIDTTYTVNSDDTTWATHPAFNWKYNQASNGFDEVIKLNGIWVGKFETSETDAYTTPESQTTALILPGVEANGTHFGWALESIKRIGIKDTLNTGGGIQNSTNPEESWPWNSNHLAISSAHLMKNSEWGAVSYLTSSAFGIGIGNLKGNVHYELTGLGPTSKAYYYEDSWPASTTGNIYGIYDMKGGRRETLAAAFSSDGIQSDQGYGSIISTPLRNTMREPYADLYPASIFPARENNGIDFCTWETCGGQALHETLLQQYSNNEDIFSWLSEDTGRSQFPTASSPWIERNYYLADDSRGEMDDMYRFFSETPAGSSSGNGYRAVVLPANLSPIQN